MSNAIRKTVVPGGCKEVERRNKVWIERAKQDALKAFAQDMPDPRDVAYYLRFAEADALLRAKGRVTPRGYILHATEADARLLRPLGLCEVGGLEITSFGKKVFDELQERDA